MTNNNNKEQVNKLFSILKLLILALIIIGIPLFVYFYFFDAIQSLSNKDSIYAVAEFLEKYRTESYFVYIGLQILQIVISVFPGQIFQMAAGYLYGFIPGLLLSIIGAALGSTVAYFLAYFLGSDAIRLFVKKETLDHWVERLNSKRAYTIVFLLYLIPGLPKDVIAYVAGISNMKLKAFLVLSILGRLPAMAASISFGAFYESGDYYFAAIIAAISIIAFIICVIKRKSINAYIDKFYDKLSQ